MLLAKRANLLLAVHNNSKNLAALQYCMKSFCNVGKEQVHVPGHISWRIETFGRHQGKDKQHNSG